MVTVFAFMLSVLWSPLCYFLIQTEDFVMQAADLRRQAKNIPLTISSCYVEHDNTCKLDSKSFEMFSLCSKF